MYEKWMALERLLLRLHFFFDSVREFSSECRLYQWRNNNPRI